MDPNIVRPVDTDENYDKDGSEVVPAGHEECKNNEARVSQKCSGKRRKMKALAELESDDSEWITIFPFNGMQKLVKCRICQTYVYSGTELPCSVNHCEAAYHLKCAQKSLPLQSIRKFKCPQHACFLCKDKNQLLRCIRCELAWHEKCAAFPEYVTHLRNQPGKAICWRIHENKEEVFNRLPIPDVDEEFDIDNTWKNTTENEMEPPPYIHVTRNIYLVKKKRDNWDANTGCEDCISSVCSEDCICRKQYISCSRDCSCSDMCTNRPFQRQKRIKVVKTELCGWGVEAGEAINKGDFIIEYVGEVISDDSCKQRMSDMTYMGGKNFYMCQVERNFTIDSTYKGNSARFLNHSCDPNCNLEKWQLDGETRIGIFAARAIQEGEPLTYDYQYIPFGPEVQCLCGTSNCRGYLGAKKKASKEKELRDCSSKGRRRAKIRR
ncbi:histone-lysine N-methyltransferase ASHR3 [Daucus carota subsp. sativus]|uniref:Histone-lysine N-methyltransferase n=1 Tax=Daucus carota subsp. sativus TaxID=79200 RepID=A0A161XSN0_DAUCS